MDQVIVDSERELIRMRDALHERGMPADDLDDSEVFGAYWRAEIRALPPERGLDLSKGGVRVSHVRSGRQRTFWLVWRHSDWADLRDDGTWVPHRDQDPKGKHATADAAILALERAGILPPEATQES